MPAVMCPRCARTILLSFWELAFPCIRCARCDGCFSPAGNPAPPAFAGPVLHCWKCGVFAPARRQGRRFAGALCVNLCAGCAAALGLWRWAGAALLTVLACVVATVLALSYLARL